MKELNGILTKIVKEILIAQGGHVDALAMCRMAAFRANTISDRAIDGALQASKMNQSTIEVALKGQTYKPQISPGINSGEKWYLKYWFGSLRRLISYCKLVTLSMLPNVFKPLLKQANHYLGRSDEHRNLLFVIMVNLLEK
jgi:hypothetical protein